MFTVEFEIEATDALDKVSTSPVTTLQIAPTRACRPSDRDLGSGDFSLLQVDGSVLRISENLRRELGLAYLFISHNLAVVDYVADRIAVMAEGLTTLGVHAEVLSDGIRIVGRGAGADAAGGA